MPLRNPKVRTCPIGVDLGSTAVKVAQMREVQGRPEVLASACQSVPRAVRKDLGTRLDFYAKSIRDMLAAGSFSGNRCVLSLPAEATFIQHVKIPKVPSGQVERALEAELHGKLPYPVENAVIRHILVGDVLGDSESRQEVIAVAASRSVLDAYLGMARRAKLDLVGVNVECCAVVECFARLFRRASDSGRTILFLDFGATSTQVVLSHGQKVVFARNLMAGGEQLDQVVAQNLRIPVEQAQAMRHALAGGNGDGEAERELYQWLNPPLNALAEELNQCLRYYESVFRNQSVERAIFVGGQAVDRRLCQAMAQRLNLPAQVGDPLVRATRAEGARLDSSMEGQQPMPQWAVAVGLSLGAAAAA